MHYQVHQGQKRQYTQNSSTLGKQGYEERKTEKKNVGHDVIPIKVWKCLGNIGVTWLTNLFNKISKTKCLMNGKALQYQSIRIKVIIQKSSNYHGMELMNYNMDFEKA